MIAFDLQCQNGHTFEGWFEDNKAYDQQQKKGLIACPVCNDTCVSKLPSTFAIRGRQEVSSPQEPKVDLERLSHKIADYVENNFDNVGADFADEALKMHYGVTEPRNIRGVSTKKEEETLKQEGIQFFKLPVPTPTPESDSES